MTAPRSFPALTPAAASTEAPAGVGVVRTQDGGNPVRHALLAMIEERGGWETAIFEVIEQGHTLQYVADTFLIKRADGVVKSISRSFLSTLIHADAQLEARLKLARRRGAVALAEETLGIADGTPADRDEVAVSKLQIDTRLRLAEAFDPETFAKPDTKVTNNISFGDLYLDMLRTRESTPSELPVKEAEIVE